MPKGRGAYQPVTPAPNSWRPWPRQARQWRRSAGRPHGTGPQAGSSGLRERDPMFVEVSDNTSAEALQA